ncbi:hypothetical protein ACLK19_20530 [Escherichia coli]
MVTTRLVHDEEDRDAGVVDVVTTMYSRVADEWFGEFRMRSHASWNMLMRWGTTRAG